MSIMLTLIWAAFAAGCTYVLVARDEQRRIAESTDDSLAIGLGPQPGVAAVVTFFFGIAAPYFLARSRGAVGFVQGIGILLVSAVGYLASLSGLVLLAGA